MRKITVASFAGTLVTASALWAGIAPATSAPVAGDLCYYVVTGGTVLGDHSVSKCVPFGPGTICEYKSAFVGTAATVDAKACVPAP